MRIAPWATLAVAVALVGCMNESQPGGPGVKPANPNVSDKSPAKDTNFTSPRNQDVVDKDQTFTLSVPATETDLKPGEREDVTISIDRGASFTQNVKLKFKPSDGIKITPQDATIKSGEKQINVTVEATPDAKPGERSIEVTAEPESGRAVSMQMKVEVDEKES